mmetsp:Transcript_6494/g.26434  ORF Transcript_6494/g.26434 Transcript_6494/m.26434 type:complete len:274 (+) Transcript_6494:59-880(+)
MLCPLSRCRDGGPPPGLSSSPRICAPASRGVHARTASARRALCLIIRARPTRPRQGSARDLRHTGVARCCACVRRSGARARAARVLRPPPRARLPPRSGAERLCKPQPLPSLSLRAPRAARRGARRAEVRNDAVVVEASVGRPAPTRHAHPRHARKARVPAAGQSAYCVGIVARDHEVLVVEVGQALEEVPVWIGIVLGHHHVLHRVAVLGEPLQAEELVELQRVAEAHLPSHRNCPRSRARRARAACRHHLHLSHVLLLPLQALHVRNVIEL